MPGQAGEARRDLEGSHALGPVLSGEGGPEGNRERLVDLLEGTLWTRRLAPTSQDIVTSLVGQIFEGIRDHFVTQAELKVRPNDWTHAQGCMAHLQHVVRLGSSCLPCPLRHFSYLGASGQLSPWH